MISLLKKISIAFYGKEPLQIIEEIDGTGNLKATYATMSSNTQYINGNA